MDKTQIPALFGNAVFGDREMRRRLPKELYRRLHGCIETGVELDAELAGAVACAMKEWAVRTTPTGFSR